MAFCYIFYSMIKTLPEIITRIRTSFSEHGKSGKSSVFTPDHAENAGLSYLTRELENKRQLGALTDSETDQLKEVDRLLDDIGRYNLKIRQTPPKSPSGTLVYDLKKKELSMPDEKKMPSIIPKISENEADQIIQSINEQFIEKVLKDINVKVVNVGQAPWEVKDFSAIKDVPDGANLYEYMSGLKNELPDKAFSDQDSDQDLSKPRTTG